MTPTVFRFKGYRFFFFSREEKRMHIHVVHADGEAKIWIEPRIEVEKSHGLSSKQVSEILQLVIEHENEIRKSWSNHFGQ